MVRVVGTAWCGGNGSTATIEAGHGGLDPADYAILQAVKESLPASNSESPQVILEYVKEAVRAHAAKTIEDCKS